MQWSGYTRLLYDYFLIKVLHHLHIKHLISKEQGVSCLHVPFFKIYVSTCIAKKGEEVFKVKQFCPISILFLMKQTDEYLMKLGVCDCGFVCVLRGKPFWPTLFFSTDHKQDIQHPSHPVWISGSEREVELWRDHTLPGHHSGQCKFVWEEEKQ